MGDIRTLSFEEEPQNIKNIVTGFWTKRAEGFAETRHDEVHSYKAGLWEKELTGRLPAGESLRILDVGCGAAFFEMILAPLGHRITGIDLTPDMIEQGKALLPRHNAGNAELIVMDAENPDFPDETFDAVI